MKKVILTDTLTGEEVAPVTNIDNIEGAEDIVYSKEIIDEDTFPDINKLTRDELKKDLFIDMWNEACTVKGVMYGTTPTKVGKYNEESDDFDLNGITGIKWPEAIALYNYRLTSADYFSGRWSNTPGLRTNLNPFSLFFAYRVNLSRACGQDMEVFVVSNNAGQYCLATDISNAFVSLKLRKIVGIINVSEIIYFTNTFNKCISLEEFTLYGLKASLDLKYSSKLTFETLQYLVTNAINTTPIIITVHPDVYSKLTDEENAEWYQLNQNALDKQITFAV